MVTTVIVPRLFEEKRRDTVFGFPWCVARGGWCVARGAWFRNFSRNLVPLTPPTVFVRSFWNFIGALRMVWRYACGFSGSWNYFLSLFSHFELRHFLSSNITEVYREQVPCPLNSSHSFWPILLKLYMGFMMAWRYACGFLQNPEIIFYYFFRIFNLDIFLVLILQKHIGSRYLVPVTPTTVLSRSFWNFTGAFRMVWRYACVFFLILKLFFIIFTLFETLQVL